MSSISPVDVYRKLNNGDALTDAEVCYGYKFYHDLEQQLRYCDREFHFAWCEARRVAEQFHNFIEARKQRT